MKLFSHNTKVTVNIAKLLAKEINRTNSFVVFGLTGDLGAGKTTFIKGLLRGLGVRKKVTSPTFLITRRFFTRKRNIYHIDAYRISKRDLLNLGFKKILKRPNVIVVEWADKVKSILPKGTIWIKFEHGKKENERYITFNRR